MRYGDFTNKKYLYKFYKNGYTSSKPKYITAGQYIDLDYVLSEPILGDATAGAVYDDVSPSIQLFGTGDSDYGLIVEVTANTDDKRKMDIDGITAVFSHSLSSSGMGEENGYYIKLFDYKILYTDFTNTLKLYYGVTELQSVTMSASYSYIRIREDSGTIYIDRSSDGITWINWDSNPIDYNNDSLRTTLEVWGDLRAGGAGDTNVFISNIDISDQSGNLLAIESTKVISDLEYSQKINTPASTTDVEMDYRPSDVPDHIGLGKFVEIYAYFENNNNITYEPILDQNSIPILDENSQEIYGPVITEPLPDDLIIQKFSGYIDNIEYDYDDSKIVLTLISHGEKLSNILMSDGTIVNNNVIEQLVQNSNESISATDRRQTFTPQSNIKLDGVRLTISASSGGYAQALIYSVTDGGYVGFSNLTTWSGALGASVLPFTFSESVYLEAGKTYAIEPTGTSGASWYYQNTDVYSGGSRQQYSSGTWNDVAGDAYFELYTAQENISFDYSGTITGLVDQIFDIAEEAYANVSVDEVDEPGYSVTTNVTLDTTKDGLDSAQRLSPSKYWYTIDLGSGGYKLKAYPTDTEHTLILGRDFTGFKLSNSISDIINDFVFTGGTINEAQTKLAIRTLDEDSIGNYKLGLAIESNEKVTTYESAQLISDYEIQSNNAPRQTTVIVVPASKYDIETIRIGDLLKILNTNHEMLSSGLQVADIDYTPYYVTISLDNSPRTINSTVDKIRRDLSNTNTSGVENVV